MTSPVKRETDQPVSNNKRRCTNFNTSPAQQCKLDNYLGLPDQQVTNSSPFRELPSIHDTLHEDVSNLIKDELHRTTTHENNQINGNEPSILSARQTQSICEKLIRDREQKMRDEYDKILACKLAEQYDLLTKANYINSYVGSTAHHIPPTTPPVAAPLHPQARNHHQQHHRHPAALAAANHQSILAAAFSSMQKSAAAAAAVTPVANSPISAQSLPNLSTLAASLAVNGHPSALTSQLAFNLQQQAAAAAALQVQQQQQQQQRPPSSSGTIPSGPVLLSSNLDEQLATPEALFTLFGVFGDVVRVKILFNKKDNALIQMADANQAQVAQSYLDKQKVFGKVIRVTRSKHQSVQMPREGNQSDVGLTKDFTNSPLHRFKFPGSRNYLNIYPPSNTLHISNIPPTIDDVALQEAFKQQCGFEYSSFKFFPKDKKMALMKFNSIEHATIALIKMHNFQISDENNLRVSFSKGNLNL